MKFKDVNLNAKEWCEIIFEGKNKSYGAYYLRKTSSKRHLQALLIIASACLLIVFLPFLIDQIIPKEKEEAITTTVVVSDVDDAKEPEEEQIVEEQLPEPPKLAETIEYVAPVITHDAPDSTIINIVTDVTQTKAAVGTTTQAGVDPNLVDVEIKESNKVIIQDTKIYDSVEKEAEFPGGKSAMITFIKNNLIYPNSAREDRAEGVTVVEFVVDYEGHIKNPKAVKSAGHPELDREAVNVIKKMKKWIPGQMDGRDVSSKFLLPIRFSLSN